MAISTIGTDALAASAVTTTKLASGVPSRSQLPAGTVLQVVSTTKTDTFSSASTSFVSVTGLSASITPTSATSKILVLVSATLGTSYDAQLFARMTRNGSAISLGDASGSRLQATCAVYVGGTMAVYQDLPLCMNYLDSPATTSSTAYSIQIACESGSQTAFVNRNSNDANSNGGVRSTSTITVMEIAA